MRPSRRNGHPVDLGLTLESGQVFHWSRGDAGTWCGLIGDVRVEVREDSGRMVVTSGSEELAARYFALDHPLEEIYAKFPTDPLSREALAMCRGLRLIRQPRWECLATFITSSMKQVAHIRAMSLAIRKSFGTPVRGSSVAAYPPADILAAASEHDLRRCGLGYRARHLIATARAVAGGEVDLEGLAALPTAELRKVLKGLPGVGEKVANCVLLFAYERLEVVPIDVWIGRVLVAMRGGRKGTPSQLAKYAERRLGPYAGYVQQYLFHLARKRKS